jgi:hypothetical protein
MRWTAAKFVPRLLTDDQKQHRLEVSTELKGYARNDPYVLSNFVTGDENWIYVHDPELKQQSSKWNCPSTPAEESTAIKKHCEVNADLNFDNDRIIHKEFVLPGQTVNAMFYCYILRRLKGDMARKRPDKWRTNNWVLHHDNAPAHTALTVNQFLSSKNVTVLTLGFSTCVCCATR